MRVRNICLMAIRHKTCMLAFCRPDKTRQRRIWHKQGARCQPSELSLPMAGSDIPLRHHTDNQHNNQPNHGVDQLQQTPGFQGVFY